METVTANFRVICDQGVAAKASAVPGGIAFTGANVVGLTLVALLLVGVGTVLVVVNRRRDRLTS